MGRPFHPHAANHYTRVAPSLSLHRMIHTKLSCYQGNTKYVFGFAKTPDPSANLDSRHSIAASDDPITESRLANVVSFGSHVSSTCSGNTTISCPTFHAGYLRSSLSTIAAKAPSLRTPFTLHQKRSPRTPTLINTPAPTLGVLLLLSRTSNVHRRSRSAALVVGLDMLSFT